MKNILIGIVFLLLIFIIVWQSYRAGVIDADLQATMRTLSKCHVEFLKDKNLPLDEYKVALERCEGRDLRAFRQYRDKLSAGGD